MDDAEFIITAAEEEACEIIERAAQNAEKIRRGSAVLFEQLELALMHLQTFMEDYPALEHEAYAAARSTIPINVEGGVSYAATAKAAE